MPAIRGLPACLSSGMVMKVNRKKLTPGSVRLGHLRFTSIYDHQATSQYGFEAGGMDERTGTGESGPAGLAGLRFCNLLHKAKEMLGDSKREVKKELTGREKASRTGTLPTRPRIRLVSN
jgi:hypothetical protein